MLDRAPIVMIVRMAGFFCTLRRAMRTMLAYMFPATPTTSKIGQTIAAIQKVALFQAAIAVITAKLKVEEDTVPFGEVT